MTRESSIDAAFRRPALSLAAFVFAAALWAASAGSASAAVAYDAGPWTGSANSQTAASATVTTPRASYLLVSVTADRTGGSADEQIISVTAPGLSFAKLAGGTLPNAEYATEFWGAVSAGPLSSVVVTATANNQSNIALTASSLIGVMTAGPAGATAGPAEAADNLSATLSGTSKGSLVFAAAFATKADALTPGSGTVIDAQINGVTQFIRSVSPSAGGAVTVSSTGYTAGGVVEYAAVEIRSQSSENSVTVAQGPWGGALGSVTQNSAQVTTAGPSFILVGVSATRVSGSADEQVVSVTAPGLSFAKLAGGTMPDAAFAAEYWGAYSSGALSGVTVTATVNNQSNFGLSVLSLAGVRAVGPAGSLIAPSESADSLSASFAGTSVGSMLFALGWCKADGSVLSAAAGTVIYDIQNSAPIFIRSLQGSAGGSQTISTVGAIGANIEYAGLEVLAEPAAAAAHGAAKDSYVPPPPSLSVTVPPAGASYRPGQTVSVDWTADSAAYVSFRVYYSDDGGQSWTKEAEGLPSSSRSYDWTVPSAATDKGAFRVDGLDYAGAVLASGKTAGYFAVAVPSSTAPSAAVQPAAPSEPAAYDPAAERNGNPDLGADYGLKPAAGSLCPFSGALLKSISLPAVYYCGADGKRYAFPNQRIYFSWYQDFSPVIVVSDDFLGQIPLGGNATYRPGSRLVKAQSDPRVYAVAGGAVLRWLPTEAAAQKLFGPDWNKLVDYTSDAFFVNYRIGDPLE